MKIKKEIYPNLPLNTEEYLEKNGYKLNINLDNQDELIRKIICYTALPREKVEIILKNIFSELRSLVLAGYRINLYTLGYIFLGKRMIIRVRLKNLFTKARKKFNELKTS